MGTFKILRQIGKVAYRLDLPLELTMIHTMFHVSMLWKFVGYPNSIVRLEDAGVEENLTYKEVSNEILDR